MAATQKNELFDPDLKSDVKTDKKDGANDLLPSAWWLSDRCQGVRRSGRCHSDTPCRTWARLCRKTYRTRAAHCSEWDSSCRTTGCLPDRPVRPPNTGISEHPSHKSTPQVYTPCPEESNAPDNVRQKWQIRMHPNNFLQMFLKKYERTIQYRHKTVW